MAIVLDTPETVLPPMRRPELLGIHLFDLTDRVAVVAGAGRGLGQAMALALAAAGADVVVSSRTYTALEALRDEIRHLGPRAEAIAVDCTEEASCERLMITAIERLGKVDILVNNAGINMRKPILDLSAEEFDRVLTTNLYGYFSCAHAAGRHMVARGSGKIINISSMMGRVALPTQGAYASSMELRLASLSDHQAQAAIGWLLAARSLFNQQMRRQGHKRIEAQQNRGTANDGAIIPLTLRCHPQMGSRFLTRDFHGPATYKSRQYLLRRVPQVGR